MSTLLYLHKFYCDKEIHLSRLMNVKKHFYRFNLKIISEQTLTHYDPNKTLPLAPDASPTG